MANYQDFMQRADETALSLTRNSQNWTAFLTTAARLYKYPYNEQLMIYSQRPDATACAEFDIWNKRMGRYIKRGSKGIMVAGAKGARYVFDVSDTGTRDKSKPFKLWEYNAEHEPVIKAMLSDRHNAEGDFIFDTVKDTTRKLAAEYWRDNRKNIIGIVANSFLEGYDSYNIRVNFINAVSVSATYSVLSRCGLEPDEYFEHEDFLPIFDFNTVDTISELGTAVSGINQQILREIEITIKNYERAKLAERTENYDRTDVHEERGLLPSEPDLSRNGADLRQVRNDERGLSQEAQDRALEQNDTSRRADTAPQRDRQDGERADRSDDAGADEESRDNGGAESDRPTQMGGLDEQMQSAGGGDYSSRTGVQLSPFPTEEEQIKIVDEAESKNELPFAFSISDTDFENLLRTGSNTDNARKRIVTEFSKNKGLESNIAFLKKIYHGGYGIKGEIDDFSAWYAEDGIHINRGSTARFSENAQIYSWVEIADKITQMLENGTFATNVEIDEYPGFERQQISETLWFLYRDLSDEARETGYLNPLKGVKPGGFPDETADIAEKLKSRQFQSSIVTELTSLIDDSQNDKSLMRSRFHNPMELLGRVKELSLPRIAYSAYHREFPDVVPFITDDEIDENLRGGSNIEGGRGRIYDFFSAEHTQQEKTQFLKDEYGIGGSSHALSGASGSFQDHSGKGISFKKDNCTEIQMSWRNVAKRITELIRADRYFSQEAMQRYEDAKGQRVADSLYGEYLVVKEANPDNMVLFQVGDFFEIFGEDAKAAADVLDIHLAQREIKDVGKVDFCGVPAFTLEANTEKLREQFSVTISAIDISSNERSTYSLAKFIPEVEQKTEITQDDIDAFIKNWNGNAESKRRVNEYILQHGRERGAAAWLANEYGSENTDVLNVTYDGLSPVELLWTTVQRTLIRMTAEDSFLTDADRAIEDEPLKFGEMTDEDKESFVQIIDMTRDYGEPLSDEDIALYDQIIEERINQHEVLEAPTEQEPVAEIPETMAEQEPITEASDTPETEDYSQYIGREIEVDDRRFVVDRINDLFETVELRDITFQSDVGFPIFRSESLEWLERSMELQTQNESIKTETVAVYPAEENNMPYDIVIERIPSDAPTPEVENFHITDDRLGEGGAKAKFRANMDAINLLKELEFDGRQATEEEQEILSKYVGWGSLPDAFDETKENWADEFQELYTALSPDEYKAAKASVLNAHYTSPTVIRAIYEAIENMGFSKGNILEPSMGVGNFFGICSHALHVIDRRVNDSAFSTWKRMYPKHYNAYQIPLEKLSNLPQRHKDYKSKTFAVPIEGKWFGITMAFITHSKYEKKPFNQKMTPYTSEGRKIYEQYRKKNKRLPCNRPSVNASGDIRLSVYAKGIYNFEYFMNREYAFNRDKWRCKCCKFDLSGNTDKHCHHVDTSFRLFILCLITSSLRMQTTTLIYDHIIYDSSTIEKPFAKALDDDPDVKMFFKIPERFKIETPIGTYNPDWAVYLERDGEKKLFFILETKGTTELFGLRTPEQLKIHCGTEHFKALDNGVEMRIAKDWKEFKVQS